MRFHILLCFLGLSAAAFVGCRGGATDSKAEDGHTRMLALLQQCLEESRQVDPFVGSERLVQAREQIARAQTPREQFDALTVAAELELQQGNGEAAVACLQQARALAEQPKSRIGGQRTQRATVRLAVAYLRMAETENCIHCRTGESCILPIRGTGVHERPDNTEKAIEYFTLALEQDPSDLTARWLLNIAAMAAGTYPDGVPEQHRIDPARFTSEEDFPRFKNIAKPLGLDTLSLLGGAVADDFDNDGLIDIAVSGWDLADQLRVFRNRGDGSFEDYTADAGLLGITGGDNLVQADYDNDGDLDLLVVRGAWLRPAYPNSLLRNDGKMRFRDVTFESGLGAEHVGSQTAAWDDFDLDGDLDLYVGNEDGAGQLFVNEGNGTFVDRAAAAGVDNRRWAKGVVWGDFNADRFPDLFVSNFEDGNRLYKNNQDGTFTDVAPDLSVSKPLHSFPAWFWDFNNDGVLDLYVPSYEFGVEQVAAEYFGKPVTSEQGRLWKGLAGGGFADVAVDVGLDRAAQPMGANFGDLDNDGYLDFYLGTGYPEYEGLMPNLMYRNVRGEKFTDVTYAGGFGHLQKGHGVAFADFDNDGDQDVLLQVGGAYLGDAASNALFENPGFGSHWIRIKLVGRQSNRCAIGARIQLDLEDGDTTRSIYRWVNSGGSFGANPLTQHIGLGAATSVKQLHVFWPKTGETQSFAEVAADQFIEIEEDAASVQPRKIKSFALQ